MSRGRKLITEECVECTTVMWVDNFNRVHFRRRPAAVPMFLNCPSVAVIRVKQGNLPIWKGHPTWLQLVNAMPQCVRDLVDLEKKFMDDLRGVLGKRPFERLRVPCDVRRTEVTAAPWRPYDIANLDIKSSDGLVDVLQYAGRQATLLSAPLLPLLSDVNIFGRVEKILYSGSYVMFDTAAALRRHPMLFGAWHGYHHSVVRTWRVFRAFWSPFQYPELLTDAYATPRLYDKPILSCLEHVIVALAVHGGKVKDLFSSCRRELEALQCGDHP